MNTFLTTSISGMAIAVLLTGCASSFPATHPNTGPSVSPYPNGKPAYTGINGNPDYPDKNIYYPDRTVYHPDEHCYYYYNNNYGYKNYNRYTY